MKKMRLAAILVGSLMVGTPAMAANDMGPILGNWVDQLPDGTGMVVGFTEETVAFTSLDTRGRSSGPPTTIKIASKKMADGTLYFTPKGDLGEPFEVKVNDADSLEIRFPGLKPRTLSREKAAQPRKSPH
jgi:hypothetical protein